MLVRAKQEHYYEAGSSYTHMSRGIPGMSDDHQMEKHLYEAHKYESIIKIDREVRQVDRQNNLCVNCMTYAITPTTPLLQRPILLSLPYFTSTFTTHTHLPHSANSSTASYPPTAQPTTRSPSIYPFPRPTHALVPMRTTLHCYPIRYPVWLRC